MQATLQLGVSLDLSSAVSCAPPSNGGSKTQNDWPKSLTRREFEISRPPVGNRLFPFQVALLWRWREFRNASFRDHGTRRFDEALGQGRRPAVGEDIDNSFAWWQAPRAHLRTSGCGIAIGRTWPAC